MTRNYLMQDFIVSITERHSYIRSVYGQVVHGTVYGQVVCVNEKI